MILGERFAKLRANPSQRLLATTQHGETAVQQLICLKQRVFGLNLRIVHVDAALLDRAASLAEALHEPRVDQQLRNRCARCTGSTGQLVERRFERRRIERRKIALAKQRFRGCLLYTSRCV